MSKQERSRRSKHRPRRMRFEILEDRRMLFSDFQNPFDKLDVNDDESISPLDALIVINYLNSAKPTHLQGPHEDGTPFLDVNGDEEASPVDVLQVINHLNSGGRDSNLISFGEGTSDVTEITRNLDEFTDATNGTVRFELLTSFDVTDQSAALRDILSVYVVDGGLSGASFDRKATRVVSITETGVDLVPGLARYDGLTVELDIRSASLRGQPQLIVQLINGDGDTGSRATIGDIDVFLSSQVPTDLGTSPQNEAGAAGSDALDLATMVQATDVEVQLGNVRYDASRTRLYADLWLINHGESIGRDVAVSFPSLPSGVSLRTSTGIHEDASYVSMRDAISAGGLRTNTESRRISIELSNPEFMPLNFTPVVHLGDNNSPPVFARVEPITVVPGSHVDLSLPVTDSDGDDLQFFLTTDNALPLGELTSSGRLRFSPMPEDIGTYEFTVSVSDGAAESFQAMTLVVVPDADDSTRISGQVLTTAEEPLAGVEIELGQVSAVTLEDGSFSLVVPSEEQERVLRVYSDN